MRTVIIGSGNVAEGLARAITGSSGMAPAGHIRPRLIQICARNREQGRGLARMMEVPYTDSLKRLELADLYIIAVSDDAVASVSEEMGVPADAVVAHTAGSLGPGALSDHITNRAVLYPLQTFTKGRIQDPRTIPFFIEYTTPRAGRIVESFASSISGRVMESTLEVRKRLHLAAVYACNFTNHMYAVAGRILNGDGLSFEIIKPLIEETAAKAIASGAPAKVQTGPAVRGDQATQELHLEILRKAVERDEIDATYMEIYKLLSKSIWETSRKK